MEIERRPLFPAEPPQNPRRTNAKSTRNPSRNHALVTDANSMQNQCRCHANPTQNPCRTAQRPCRIHAKAMRNPRKTQAAPMQNPRRSHADHAGLLLFAAVALQLDDELASLEALELLLPRRLAACFLWRPALARLLAAWASSLRTFSTTASRRAVGPVAYAACFSRRRCKARRFSGSDSVRSCGMTVAILDPQSATPGDG